MKVKVLKKASAIDADGFISSVDKIQPPSGYEIYAEIDSLNMADAIKSLSFKTDVVMNRSPQVIVAKLAHALICSSVPFSLEFKG